MERFKNTNLVPLGIALQALIFFVATLFVAPTDTTTTTPHAAGVGSKAADTPDGTSSLAELPRDLQREMLPVPRVPKRQKRDEPPQPTPSDDGAESLTSEGPKLASLRTRQMALSGPVAIPISAPMIGVPDTLDGLSLANGSWVGGGNNAARRRGVGQTRGPIGIGGTGMGGMGSGSGGGGGGYCPAPPGGGRGR